MNLFDVLFPGGFSDPDSEELKDPKVRMERIAILVHMIGSLQSAAIRLTTQLHDLTCDQHASDGRDESALDKAASGSLTKDDISSLPEDLRDLAARMIRDLGIDTNDRKKPN